MNRLIIVIILLLNFQNLFSQTSNKRLRIGAGITYLFNLEALENLGQPFIPLCNSASLEYQFSEISAIEAKYSRYVMNRDFNNGFNEVCFRDIIFLTLNYKKVIIGDGNYKLKSQLGVSFRQAEETYRFNQIEYPGAYFYPLYLNPAVSMGLSNEFIIIPALSLEFDVNYFYNIVNKDRISYYSRRVDPSALKYSVQNIMLSLRLVGNINLTKSPKSD